MLDPIGQALGHGGHYEEATAIFHKALDLIGEETSNSKPPLLDSPLHDRALVLIHLAQLLSKQGTHYEQALAAGEEALDILTRISPCLIDRAECLRLLGTCYEKVGNREKAIINTGMVSS